MTADNPRGLLEVVVGNHTLLNHIHIIAGNHTVLLLPCLVLR